MGGCAAPPVPGGPAHGGRGVARRGQADHGSVGHRHEVDCLVGELQPLHVAERVGPVGADVVGDRQRAVGGGDHVVVRTRAREHRGVDRAGAGQVQDLAFDPEVARVDQAGEERLLQRPARRSVTEGPGERLVLEQVRAADLGAGRVAGWSVEHADPHLKRPVAVQDVVAAAALEAVRTGATDQDVPVAPDVPGQRAEPGEGAGSQVRPGERRRNARSTRNHGCGRVWIAQGRHDLVQPRDAADTGGIQGVASGEPAARNRGGLVTPDDVVERRAGVGLRLLPAVAVDDHGQRHVDEHLVDLQVVVAAHGVVLVDGPVEPAATGIAVDRRVLRHDVVAALGVVVVLTRLADEDVVAGLELRRVVEERRAVVADSRSWLLPPWIQSSPPPPNTASAPSPAMMKSSPRPRTSRCRSRPPLRRSWPSPPMGMSSPGPASMASLPGPPFCTSPPSRSVMCRLRGHQVRRRRRRRPR